MKGYLSLTDGVVGVNKTKQIRQHKYISKGQVEKHRVNI